MGLLFVCLFWGSEYWTQGLRHARQLFYHWGWVMGYYYFESSFGLFWDFFFFLRFTEYFFKILRQKSWAPIRSTMKKKHSQAGRVAQVIDHLPSKCDTLSSNPSKYHQKNFLIFSLVKGYKISNRRNKFKIYCARSQLKGWGKRTESLRPAWGRYIVRERERERERKRERNLLYNISYCTLGKRIVFKYSGHKKSIWGHSYVN
jgi:hypothetical protein